MKELKSRLYHPADIVNRVIALEDVYRNYDLVDVRKINHKFVELAYDENDEEILILNLEYAMFEAPLPEVKFMIESLYAQKQLAEAKDTKLDNLAKAMGEDAIKQGIPEEDASKAIRDMIMRK